MAASPHEWHMSVEDYLKLDRDSPQARYEYIDGRVRMLAGGTPDHAKISANIIGVLYGLLEESGCSIYTSDVRVRISATRYVYPDVAVSCEEEDQEQGEMIQHPCLIVEVLSRSAEAIEAKSLPATAIAPLCENMCWWTHASNRSKCFGARPISSGPIAPSDPAIRWN